MANIFKIHKTIIFDDASRIILTGKNRSDGEERERRCIYSYYFVSSNHLVKD